MISWREPKTSDDCGHELLARAPQLVDEGNCPDCIGIAVVIEDDDGGMSVICAKWRKRGC